MHLTAAQFSAFFEALDWKRVHAPSETLGSSRFKPPRVLVQSIGFNHAGIKDITLFALKYNNNFLIIHNSGRIF